MTYAIINSYWTRRCRTLIFIQSRQEISDEDKIGNHDKFKKATKYSIDKAYVEYWKTQLRKPEQTRLEQTNLNKQDWIFMEK